MKPAADNGTGDQAQGEQLDNRVIPVMREAVATVQMVCFGELKDKLADRFKDWEPAEFRRLVGAVISDIFGTPAPDGESVQFARKHQDTIEKELWALADNLPDLLPHLTDALRMQTLCDHEQGINSIPTLLRADRRRAHGGAAHPHAVDLHDPGPAAWRPARHAGIHAGYRARLRVKRPVKHQLTHLARSLAFLLCYGFSYIALLCAYSRALPEHQITSQSCVICHLT